MRIFLPFLLLFVIRLNAQADYKSIQNSDLYISASATASSVEEAQTIAMNMLIKQISSVVSSSTTMSISADNSSSEQKFDNISKSSTTLRLEGLKYIKIPGAKNDKAITYLAYISKEDLQRSADAAAKEVHSHLDLMEYQKSIGIDYISSVYLAYLSSYFTPYPIGYKFDMDTVSNVQPYLATLLSEHLSKVEIVCEFVEEHPIYPKDQLRFNLILKGGIADNLQYTFTCSSYNAIAEMGMNGGAFDVMMRPNAPIEQMKGVLSIKAIGLNDKLKDISKNVTIEQSKEFDADMSGIIQYDFDVKESENYVQLIPSIKNISVNAFEWSSNGKMLSTDQAPKISKSDLGETVVLKLNNNESLKRSKPIDISKIIIETEKQELVTVPLVEKKENNKETKLSEYKKESYGFQELKKFEELQDRLMQIKNAGKGIYGKKAIFVKPQSCWVFLINSESKEIAHVLSPDENGRFDLINNTTYSDFESTLKGFIAIWVEMY